MNFKDHLIILEMAKGTIDKKEYIPGSKYDMAKRFKHWNAKLFKGILPTPKFEKKRNNVSGSMAFRVDRLSKRIVDVEDWVLTINPKGKRTEEGWDAILIHEMVHLSLQYKYLGRKVSMYKQEVGRDGHGEVFVKKIDELSKLLPFTIPITDELTGIDLDTPLKSEVFFMIHEYQPGKFAVLLLRPKAIQDPRIKDAISQIANQFENKGIKFASGYTNNGKLNGITIKNKWPRGRTSWAMVPDEVGQELIKMGLNI